MPTLIQSSGNRYNAVYRKTPPGQVPPFDYETRIRVYANNCSHVANPRNGKVTDLSIRLRERRKELGFSQLRLGDLAEEWCREHGYHFGGKKNEGSTAHSRQTLISQYETNRCTPKIDNLTPLANILQTTLEDLMGQDNTHAYLGHNGYDLYMANPYILDPINIHAA